MQADLSNSLRQKLERAALQLQAISEEQAAQKPSANVWSRKEELGHLLDSAVNNHYRIAHAAVAGEFRGSPYQQNEWVSLHGYQELPWTTLVDLWKRHNWMIAHLVARIPAGRLEAPCEVVGYASYTLRTLIEDYLSHMEHHLESVIGGKAAAAQ